MTDATQRTQFKTTTQGLDRESPPMRLFEKAKQFGIWNPSEIDFTQDQQDWAAADPTEREVMLHLTTLFQAGEEAVTLDLLPLIMTIAREGRIEEEMFLTTFLWEEAKHVDFFSRFLNTVVSERGDLTRFESDAYRTLFYDRLPAALTALNTDSSPAAQACASATYNIIVEGVLAETGYHSYFTMLDRNNIFPGLRSGILRLKQDESRHIAYGVYLLSRLLSADPDLWESVESTLNDLLPIAMAIIAEPFTRYDPMPFGLDPNEFAMFAMRQYQNRVALLQKARQSSLDEVVANTNAALAL